MRALSNTFRSPALHLAVITVLCILVYSNTFSVPFHFDDKLNIVDNAQVKELKKFWPPSGSRWFGYLTFALNYRTNGLDPTGYHMVNLAIHVLNSLLVYWLVVLTFRTPYCAASRNRALETLRNRIHFVAPATALLFACHPVQTQAVTYIVQRFASLATLLFLLALTCYIQARLPVSPKKAPGTSGPRSGRLARSGLYALSLAAAVLAMKTKEIAFTLPVVVAVYELSFLRPQLSGGQAAPYRRIVALLPFGLTLLIIPLSMQGRGVEEMLSSFRATEDISRIDYLLTQFRVIMTYLRLLLLPIGQSIDYDIPAYRNILEPAVLFSVMFLSVLAGAACFLIVRSRSSRGPERIAAFGLIWFFVTLSVESSIVPLPDVIFEHRLYLPSTGFFLAVVIAGYIGSEALQRRFPLGKGTFAAAFVLLIAVLAAATFTRNKAWSSEIVLWQDAVAKYPGAHRAYTVLGGLYRQAGRTEEAKEAFLRSLALKPGYAEARVNLGSIYADEGLLDEAMQEFMTAAGAGNMDEVDTGLLFLNIGNCYRMKNLPDKEIEYYTYALGLIPGDASVHFSLARAYMSKGLPERARQYFHRAHELNPDRY